MPTTKDGRLFFADQNAIDTYIAFTDSLQNAWLPSTSELSPVLEETDYQYYSAMDALEKTYFFDVTTLRSFYDSLRTIDINYGKTLNELYIPDPDTRKILNSANEVQVGDTIYKYVTSKILGKVPTSNPEAVEALTKYGLDAASDNITFLNAEQGITWIPNDFPQKDKDVDLCKLEIKYIDFQRAVDESRPYLTRLRFQVRSTTRFEGPCEKLEYTIKWGDGSVEKFTRDGFADFYHNYGRSGNFNIQIEVNLILGCGNCGGGRKQTASLDAEVNGVFCSNKDNTSSSTQSARFKLKDTPYRIDYEVGARTTVDWLQHDRKIWFDIVDAEYQSSRTKRWYNTKMNLTNKIAGYYFANQCQIVRNLDITKFAIETNNNYHKYKTGEEFGMKKDALKGTLEAKNGDGTYNLTVPFNFY